MIRKIIILATAMSFLLTSPALAIQKKKAGQAKENAKVENKSKSSDSGEKALNATPPPAQRKVAAPPPKPPKRDRFTDENGDGLNDSIKKQPRVKVKKKKTSDKEKESKHRRR